MAGKQTTIPGTERPINERMEAVIGELVDRTKKKTKANQEWKKADDAIERTLIEEKLTEYTSEEHGKTAKLGSRVTYSSWSPPEPESADDDAPKKKRGKKSKASSDAAEGGDGEDLDS